MTSRTVAGLLAAGLLAAAPSVAGCGGIGGGTGAPAATTTGDAPTSVAPTGARPPRRSGGALTSPPAAGAGNAGQLPAGFPLPPGTKVGPVAVGSGGVTARLSVPDGKHVYDFWRSRLPAAGYTVTGAEMVGGIGQISFTGRDCTGPSQLGINDDAVTFACARG
jgi:hypothetical protein